MEGTGTEMALIKVPITSHCQVMISGSFSWFDSHCIQYILRTLSSLSFHDPLCPGFLSPALTIPSPSPLLGPLSIFQMLVFPNTLSLGLFFTYPSMNISSTPLILKLLISKSFLSVPSLSKQIPISSSLCSHSICPVLVG